MEKTKNYSAEEYMETLLLKYVYQNFYNRGSPTEIQQNGMIVSLTKSLESKKFIQRIATYKTTNTIKGVYNITKAGAVHIISGAL